MPEAYACACARVGPGVGVKGLRGQSECHVHQGTTFYSGGDHGFQSLRNTQRASS